jgi:diguanylate cyclase (GGDEF)-like protein/PAS domain S-box-containing protein
MLILSLITVGMIILIIGISVYNEIIINKNILNSLEQTIRKNYDDNIKNQVENVITLLDGINKKYEAGELNLEQAKKLSADLIRNLRYGDDGYFWVDTTEGTNVVLLGSSTEGTNRYDSKDAKGNLMIQQIIEVAIKEGGGYSDYYFPKAGEKQSLPKRAYSKFFEPFNWVIGTGNYVDDIDKVVAEKRVIQNKELNENILIFIVLFIIFVSVVLAITFVISANITIPLEAAVNQAKQISNGALTIVVPEEFKRRNDEVGELSKFLEEMQNAIKEFLKSLEEKTEIIQKEKDFFNTMLISIGDGVIATDKNRNVTLLNIVAESITGWTKEEALGKQFDDIFNIFNEQTKEVVNNPVKEVLDKGEIIELSENTILISKQGSEIPIEDSAAPIKDKKGDIAGVIIVFRDITEKKKKQKNIEYLSFHDQLTGLYNRRFFEEENKRLDTERNYPLSFVMADVNGLKLTNDAFGHLFGDKLIQKVAEILKKHSRADDIIARIGGDEFVILLPKTNLNEVEKLVNRIKEAVSLEKLESINLSVSFGYETKNTANYPMNEVFKKAENNMYNQKLSESQSAREKIINIIIHKMFEKYHGYEDYYTRISKTCELIGNNLELNMDEMKDLKKAALLHDIGNATLNESILLKKGRLTDLEYIEVKRHAEAGYHILKSVNKMAKVSEYVLAHHERWDGKGYPRGLKGNEIPLESRIISIADAYNSMISDRPFRKALSKNKAIEEIKNNVGTQFDPKVVKAFLKAHENK